MNTYRGEGNRINYDNDTGSDIDSSDVVVGTDGIGVAVTDIANSASGVLEITGVHELAAAAAESWDVLEELYWDTVAEELTQTASGNIRAGLSSKEKAVSAVVAQVKLNA
jgi:predicted RecA/RadA family phage recombinase